MDSLSAMADLERRLGEFSRAAVHTGVLVPPGTALAMPYHDEDGDPVVFVTVREIRAGFSEFMVFGRRVTPGMGRAVYRRKT